MGIACVETLMVIKEAPLRETMQAVFDVFLSQNMLPTIDALSPILLNETGDGNEDALCEIYPTNTEEAFAAILNHPTGGIIEFQWNGKQISVACTCRKEDFVCAASFWIFESYYHLEVGRRYDEIIDVCHEKLNALRTIQGWNLMDYIDSEACEAERVYDGIFEGAYRLDLRGRLVFQDVRVNNGWFD